MPDTIGYVPVGGCGAIGLPGNSPLTNNWCIFGPGTSGPKATSGAPNGWSVSTIHTGTSPFPDFYVIVCCPADTAPDPGSSYSVWYGAASTDLDCQTGATYSIGFPIMASNSSGTSAGSSGTSAGSSQSRSSMGNSSGSDGSGCVQAGTTGSVPMAYDSTDPIYADSAGYWVVFDDTIKVIADIDTPSGWSMDFDDPINPSTAFVGAAPNTLSGNYYINYYFPLPTSSSSSASMNPGTSSSSSGSGGDVGLFVSTFCVTSGSGSSGSLGSGGSASQTTSGQASASGSGSQTSLESSSYHSASSANLASASGSSSLTSASSSSLNSGGSESGQPSASSSSGGVGPCKAYKDDYFNVPFDKNYKYPADGAMFHGTNNTFMPEPLIGTNKVMFRFKVLPSKAVGVCIPSNGALCSNLPDTSWTNFQTVLTEGATRFNLPWKTWTFNFVGQTSPLPEGSLRCHTYEALPGLEVGYVKGQNLRVGVRFHIEYCPGPTPPSGTPMTNLHWIQIRWTNYGEEIGVCEDDLVTNVVDVGTPYFLAADEIGNAVLSECENKESVKASLTGVALVDHPQFVQSKHPEQKPLRVFRAETFLCMETEQLNSKGGKIVNVYNGVQWGFQLEQLNQLT